MAELPEAFQARVRGQLGADFPAFLDALRQPPPVSIRRNPRKTANLDLPLAGAIPWCPEDSYLSERPVFTRDPLFHVGAYYVQEASSMLAGWALRQAVDPATPLRVLDLCAAPGGKSTHLASLLGDDSLLVANETIRARVAPLRENLTRWGWPNVLIASRDPDDFAPLAGFFDVVLVDAPCSGEGLFRKDPDAVGEWSPEAAERCALRQRRILAAASPLVRPGGLLLYSTCTYNPEENDARVHTLVAEGGFAPIPLAFPPEWGVDATAFGGQCWPHRIRGEGFYLALLRRAGDAPLGQYLASPPAPPVEGPARDFLAAPDDFAACPKRTTIYRQDSPINLINALPRSIFADASVVCRAVGATPLLTLGAVKGKDFIPDHTLALSTARRTDLPTVALDLQDARRYLKKDPFDLPAETPRGWAIVTHAGLPLGWLKILPDRFNNYLPNDARIRMSLD